jgi:hypothetical protein
MLRRQKLVLVTSVVTYAVALRIKGKCRTMSYRSTFCSGLNNAPAVLGSANRDQKLLRHFCPFVGEKLDVNDHTPIRTPRTDSLNLDSQIISDKKVKMIARTSHTSQLLPIRTRLQLHACTNPSISRSDNLDTFSSSPPAPVDTDLDTDVVPCDPGRLTCMRRNRLAYESGVANPKLSELRAEMCSVCRSDECE